MWHGSEPDVGGTRRCQPEDRISLSTGYAYQDWDASLAAKGLVARACARLNILWHDDQDVDDLEDQGLLDELLKMSPLYRFFYSLYEDHSMAFWHLRQSVRAVAGLSGFEELLFLVDSRGSNGKSTWLQLLKAILGVEGGYFATLDYEKHFIGSGMAQKNVNNPDIAALVGARIVSVNESPESSKGGDRKFNTTLAKKIGSSGDDPINASAKYKDPASFQPQCTLVFCTNNEPEFPPNDGGFRSRVSYVNMPFQWVQNPKGPGERQIDPEMKERLVKTMRFEFLFWARHLVPGLVHPKGRIVTPRPAKVQEDVAVQFAASAVAASLTTYTHVSASELGRRFAEERLKVWDRQEGAPSSRQEIKEAFLQWCAEKNHNRVNPDAAFRDVLLGSEQKYRVNFDGKTVHVYRRQSLGGMVGGSSWKVEVQTLRPSPR